MTNTVWCFEHEEMIELETGKCTGHTFIVYEDAKIGLSNLDFHCMTPDDFAYCPPPPFTWDWMTYGNFLEWVSVNEPSSSEIFVMNCHARELESTW